jgi:hypothetical protein
MLVVKSQKVKNGPHFLLKSEKPIGMSSYESITSDAPYDHTGVKGLLPTALTIQKLCERGLV